MIIQSIHFRKILVLLFILPVLVFADAKSELIAFWQSVKAENQLTDQTAHCGFIDQMHLRELIQNSSPEIKALAKASKIFERPDRQDSVLSPYGHFLMCFDSTGVHAVPQEDAENNGIPDYIDSAGVYLENAWDVEINQLGFLPPPGNGGNPVEVYKVYFTDFATDYGQTYYGLTTPETIISYTGVTEIAYTSFFELHNNYESSAFYSTGLAGLKVTAAHEFNHAIQLGYNADYFNNIYFMEMTSTWLEDYVYDDVNDYVFYLNSFFRYLFTQKNRQYPASISFTSADDLDPYANCLYNHMLEKQYGPEIIVDIWGKIIQHSALYAINEELESRNSSFAESQNQYAGWLYFTGSRSIPDTYFPEGSSYPELTPNTGMEALDLGLNSLTVRLIELLPDFDGLARAKISSLEEGKFSHIINHQHLTSPIDFGGNDIITLSNNDSVIVVLSNPGNSSIQDLQYSVERDKIHSGPIPVIAKKRSSQIEFTNMPVNGVIYIYNILGQKIITLRNGSENKIQWNLKDHSDRYIASGAYIYYVKAVNYEYAGKLTVLR
jgi:hypothetical protein